MKELIKYDAARSALKDCASVDEALGWSDHAAALEAYARQAKDKDMQKMAADIRMRAKRRLGEMMALQKSSGVMGKGGRPKKPGVALNPIQGPTPITLAEAGINKRLAHEARMAAGMSPEAFEQAIEDKKTAIDSPDFHSGAQDEPETYDPREEALDLATEAMAIIDADDKLKAAMDEIAKAKRETKTISALYDSVKGEVAAFKRDSTRWMKKAKKSALCPTCKAALEAE